MIDFEACLAIAVCKDDSESDRISAIENLLYCNDEFTKNALYTVAMDESESLELRIEATGTLAFLWAESAIEYELLFTLPETIIEEVKNVFALKRVKIDEEKLEGHLERFTTYFEGTKIIR